MTGPDVISGPTWVRPTSTSRIVALAGSCSAMHGLKLYMARAALLALPTSEVNANGGVQRHQIYGQSSWKLPLGLILSDSNSQRGDWDLACQVKRMFTPSLREKFAGPIQFLPLQ